MMALVITNVALVITNVALVMYIVYIIVKFQKSNYQSCIGNNQCLNDNNQFRICRYQLLTNWLLPMQDWLLPNVFSARGNNQFSMPLLPMHGFTVNVWYIHCHVLVTLGSVIFVGSLFLIYHYILWLL